MSWGGAATQTPPVPSIPPATREGGVANILSKCGFGQVFSAGSKIFAFQDTITFPRLNAIPGVKFLLPIHHKKIKCQALNQLKTVQLGLTTNKVSLEKSGYSVMRKRKHKLTGSH